MDKYEIRLLSAEFVDDVRINDLNQWGLAVGAIIFGNPPVSRAAAWHCREGSFRQLFAPGTGNSEALAVNDQGEIVGTWQQKPGSATRAFFTNWLEGSAVDLTFPEATEWTAPADINNHGMIVGNYSEGRALNFLYNAHTRQRVAVGFGLPLTSGTAAYGINDRGQIIGGCGQNFNASDRKFVRQPNGDATELLGFDHPMAINDNWIVGNTGNEGFRIHVDELRTNTVVRFPGALRRVNSYGHAVGWWDEAERLTAAYFDGRALTAVNALLRDPSGWELLKATAINDDFEIVGTGVLNGLRTGFYMSLPRMISFGHPSRPVPRDLALVSTILIGGVTQDGGGTAVFPPGLGVPIGPWGWSTLSAAQRDALIGLALNHAASVIGDRDARTAVEDATLRAISKALERLRKSHQEETSEDSH